ncbi:MAG: hypothetical protein ABSE96_21640 [Terracidiphilus sp.]
MESKEKTLNKGYIILDEVAAALAHGEDVEFPFGSLKRVHHSHKEKHGWFLNKIRTIYKKPYSVALEVGAKGMSCFPGF